MPMLGPTLFLVAVEALASEAVATSAIEGVHLNPNAAYAASWMRLQAREVTELKEQALAANPLLTPAQAEQVALRVWMKLMLTA